MAADPDPVAGLSAASADLAGTGWPYETLFAGHERPGKSSGIPRYYERTLWRRSGSAPSAGARAGDRRMEIAAGTRNSPRSLPSERGARGVRGAGARAVLHGGYGAIVLG